MKNGLFWLGLLLSFSSESRITETKPQKKATSCRGESLARAHARYKKYPVAEEFRTTPSNTGPTAKLIQLLQGGPLYLEENQRRAYLVEVRDGRLVYLDGRHPPQHSIYVMDENGEIYVGPNGVSNFQHTSFFGQLEMAAAGELIFFEDGRLEKVNRNSNRFQTTQEMLEQFLEELRRREVDLTQTKIQRQVEN
jgi:hypothetical protein